MASLKIYDMDSNYGGEGPFDVERSLETSIEHILADLFECIWRKHVSFFGLFFFFLRLEGYQAGVGSARVS